MTSLAVGANHVNEVVWDLEALVFGEGDAGAMRLLGEAERRAERFWAAHAGRVAELDAGGLAAAIAEIAEIIERLGRAGNYAMLRFSADTADPANEALLQRVQERIAQIETRLLFFDLEWVALPDAVADALLGSDGLEQARHHLRAARRYRPYLLSEPEERILAEKSVNGSSAWARLFNEQVSTLSVELHGDRHPVTLDVALTRLWSADQEARRSTAEAITSALAPGLRTRAFVLNTLMGEKATDDRLRGYSHWLASRNLANDISDASVAALIDAVRSRYVLAQRWYALKARLLGIARLKDYDRLAPVAGLDEEFSWAEARDTVLAAYTSFAPWLGDAAETVFTSRSIHAPVRSAKRGGSFCASTVPGAHPYVLLNFTSRRRDVLTLAHEIGHAVHAALAQRRGIFEQHTPLTLSETASVFGEMLVFDQLLEQAPSAESRLALLAESIEGSIATVFRQTAMTRFEDLAHTARRGRGELTIEQLNTCWADTQAELLGTSVEITDGYRTWWSYVPHFFNTPGYVYAYAYGQLLAMAIYQRYSEDGEALADAYGELLAAGGSKSPTELGAIVGVDLEDPAFWDRGLDLMERQLRRAELAAHEARPQLAADPLGAAG